jgi:hypothetical protein
MAMLTGRSYRGLVAQALLVDFNYVQRCLSIATVVANLCGPMMSPRTRR